MKLASCQCGRWRAQCGRTADAEDLLCSECRPMCEAFLETISPRGLQITARHLKFRPTFPGGAPTAPIQGGV